MATGMPITDGLAGTSILVIDDDNDALYLLATCLERAGANVLRAASVDAALALLTTWGADVVLCDLHLPEVDSYGFLSSMRAIRKLRDVPVVAISGSHPTLERERSLRAGFARYLTKPARLGEVVAAVKSVVASHRERARLVA